MQRKKQFFFCNKYLQNLETFGPPTRESNRDSQVISLPCVYIGKVSHPIQVYIIQTLHLLFLKVTNIVTGT